MMSMPPPGSRVVFYSRYSSALQSYSSIEGQERLCAAYAEKHGWVEAGRYSDAERSGTTTLGRQGLFQMLAAAERGDFDVLLVEDIDRTSRDAADMHRIAKDLEELDITLCTVAGGVVTDMELAFKAVQNQQFIKQNAFKVKRGQELVVASGRMSGSVPYGYRKVSRFDAKGEPINGLREIDPQTGPIVMRVHLDFDAGRSTFEICTALNAEGIPGPKGRLWRPGALTGSRQGSVGILRNPIYIGEFQFRKTERKRRKGKIKVRFTAASERIVAQHPELVIVDKDIWDRNQARLAENDDRPFYSGKKVEYVFSGKVFCGRCGSTCFSSNGRYVCTGRAETGVCDNTRRARREAVEESVFRKIKEHLLTTDLLGPCVNAYREEAERALAEHAARTEADGTRLKEVDQRISNLMTQLGASSETSFASQIMLGEIEKLGAEKARLEQQNRLAPRPAGPALDPETVVQSISTTLDDLQGALQRDDREAVRARELIRGLVDRLVLAPVPGSTTDGRGAGDMTVTVEGPLAALLDLADLSVDRVAKHGHRPMFVLDNATSVWRFSYVLEWLDPRVAKVYADLPVVSKLLDEADVPITLEAFFLEFARGGAVPCDDDGQTARLRVRRAVEHLKGRGFIRAIMSERSTRGWVWNDRGISDEEWKERIKNPPMTRTIPTIRMEGPGAAVVIIGARGT